MSKIKEDPKQIRIVVVVANDTTLTDADGELLDQKWCRFEKRTGTLLQDNINMGWGPMPGDTEVGDVLAQGKEVERYARRQVILTDELGVPREGDEPGSVQAAYRLYDKLNTESSPEEKAKMLQEKLAALAAIMNDAPVLGEPEDED